MDRTHLRSTAGAPTRPTHRPRGLRHLRDSPGGVTVRQGESAGLRWTSLRRATGSRCPLRRPAQRQRRRQRRATRQSDHRGCRRRRPGWHHHHHSHHRCHVPQGRQARPPLCGHTPPQPTHTGLRRRRRRSPAHAAQRAPRPPPRRPQAPPGPPPTTAWWPARGPPSPQSLGG